VSAEEFQRGQAEGVVCPRHLRSTAPSVTLVGDRLNIHRQSYRTVLGVTAGAAVRPSTAVDQDRGQPGGGFGYTYGVSVVPIGDARDSFSKLIAEVELTHERVTITRHGKAVAVVMSAEDLEALEETADMMTTPGAADAIAEGVAELNAGQEVSGPEVLARFRRG
jgi:prevent-host-death family protein